MGHKKQIRNRCCSAPIIGQDDNQSIPIIKAWIWLCSSGLTPILPSSHLQYCHKKFPCSPRRIETFLKCITMWNEKAETTGNIQWHIPQKLLPYLFWPMCHTRNFHWTEWAPSLGPVSSYIIHLRAALLLPIRIGPISARWAIIPVIIT